VSGQIINTKKKGKKKCLNKKTSNVNAKTVQSCTKIKKKNVVAKKQIVTNKNPPIGGFFSLR
jgi:hypothetical protein